MTERSRGSQPPDELPGDEGADTGAELDSDSIVALPLTDVLDLHGFAPRDLAEIVVGYLDDAIAAGFEGVRIIHGKGIGVQREAVRRRLAADPRVARFEDAPEHQGGKGATVVWLARR